MTKRILNILCLLVLSLNSVSYASIDPRELSWKEIISDMRYKAQFYVIPVDLGQGVVYMMADAFCIPEIDQDHIRTKRVFKICTRVNSSQKQCIDSYWNYLYVSKKYNYEYCKRRARRDDRCVEYETRVGNRKTTFLVNIVTGSGDGERHAFVKEYKMPACNNL